MKWKKLGVVWQPDGTLPWARRYATCPTPFLLPDGTLRVYLQSRDDDNVGRVGYVDLDPENPLRVRAVCQSPVLDVGEPGAFDDNGVFQTSVVAAGSGKIFMYYVGFELCHRIRYRLLTGLAVSVDGGQTFIRRKSTPILERSEGEMIVRGGPFVIRTPDKFRMWYVAGNAWETIDGKAMPVYDLRYIESHDGIDWPVNGTVVLPIDHAEEHGFGRPYVVPTASDEYQMYYSVRRRSPLAYRMGYAESRDGLSWVRKDHAMGLDVSAEGWDSESVEYAAPIQIGGKTYCFYNGNDFGVTGFGVAELLE